MLNKVIVMGRLTRDPELRYTQTNTPVVSFSLACDRDYSSGERKQTDFLDCVAWSHTAEFIKKYFGKGRAAVVEGRLQVRNWEDDAGTKRKTAEIVVNSIYFADSKPESKQEREYASPRTENSFDGFDNEDEGDLPF